MGDRYIVIYHIHGEYAVVVKCGRDGFILPGKPGVTRIRLNRFRGGCRGYSLIKEA